MTLALANNLSPVLEATYLSTPGRKFGRQSEVEFSSLLSSIILPLGEDPSLNIISILESGAEFLQCSHLNYVEKSEDREKTPRDHEAVKFSVTGGTRELWLYDFCGEPDSEKIKIFLALLSQQERRLREIMRLRNLKEYNKKLFESCPDAIVVCDENASIINTNRAMVSMTRRPAESLVGLKVNKLVTKESRSVAFQALRKLAQQPLSHCDCRMKIGPDRSIPVTISFSDFTFQNQRLILATVRDLSYLATEAQKDSAHEQSLAHPIANATDGFVRYNQFGRITKVNPYLERLTGVSASRLVGRAIDDLFSVSSLRNFRKAVTQLNASGYASFDCEIKVSDRNEVPARATLMQYAVDGEPCCRLLLQVHSDSRERLPC